MSSKAINESRVGWRTRAKKGVVVTGSGEGGGHPWRCDPADQSVAGQDFEKVSTGLRNGENVLLLIPA
jgi:hypothetical protein